jgi:hypothetical protein
VIDRVMLVHTLEFSLSRRIKRSVFVCKQKSETTVNGRLKHDLIPVDKCDAIVVLTD